LVALSVLHENYSCFGEVDIDHLRFFKRFEDLFEKTEKEMKKIEKLGSSCCLLKRFFEISGQFSEKSFKITNKIGFTK